MNETIAKMTTAAGRHPTPLLCDALLTLEARPKLDEAERLTRAVLMDVLCARHPEADAAFDRWADDLDAPPEGAVLAVTDAALQAASA
jgi:hypothetical protein